MVDQLAYSVAIIGAGPAGLYAANELAKNGIQVTLFNRDIKPGGLAEYGVYPQKHRLKDGFRAQFRQILACENIDYYGNVLVRKQDGDLSLDDIWEMGFQAVLVTVGAQGTNWLGLPGENLDGVYHAKEIVYHYNKLPPYGQQKYHLGKRVAIIGAGNVMMDIARYMVSEIKADEITTIARRGPGEVKFDKGELDAVANNIDLEALKKEIERVRPMAQSVSVSLEKPLTLIESVLPKAIKNDSNSRFYLRFLLSPVQILGNQAGAVTGIEVEDNALKKENDVIKAYCIGTRHVIEVDTVIFAIGDRVDDQFGLPVRDNEFVKNPDPRFPIEGISYEAFDPNLVKALDGVYVAGWARRASTGLVGITRRDGINGSHALMKYLETLQVKSQVSRQTIDQRLVKIGHPVVGKIDLARLENIENDMAQRLGVPEFKFASHEEMLQAIGHHLAGVR